MILLAVPVVNLRVIDFELFFLKAHQITKVPFSRALELLISIRGRWPEPHPYLLGFYSTSSDRSDSSPSLLPPLLVAGVMRAGMLEMAHADADENPTASEPLPSFGVAEGLANQERQRLEELLRSKGMQRGSYPPFTVSVRGQKVSIKFRIPLTCEVSHDIVSLVSQLGLKAEESSRGSETLLCAWDRNPSGNLTSHPYKMGSG